MPAPTPAFPSCTQQAIYPSLYLWTWTCLPHRLTSILAHAEAGKCNLFPCRAYLCKVHPIFHFWMSCQKPVMVITLSVLTAPQAVFQLDFKASSCTAWFSHLWTVSNGWPKAARGSPWWPESTPAHHMPHAGLILKDSAPLTFSCSSQSYQGSFCSYWKTDEKSRPAWFRHMCQDRMKRPLPASASLHWLEGAQAMTCFVLWHQRSGSWAFAINRAHTTTLQPYSMLNTKAQT